ncbi:MAG: TlpA disulfide reductase family protein [Spirochaetota bacterium]
MSLKRVAIILDIVIILLYTHAFIYSQEKIPNVALYTVEGKRVILYSIIGMLPDNGIVVMNFTSVNCPPCKKEIPELLFIAKTSKKPVTILFIYSENGTTVLQSAKEMGIKDTVYCDVLDNVRKQFNITQIPTTIVINREGNVLGKYIGYSEKNMREIKEKVM